jgi:hypothetical protein
MSAQKIIEVTERERRSEKHPHAELDDLARGPEAPERVLAHT